MIGKAAMLLLAAQWPGDQEIPPVRYPTIASAARTAAGFTPAGWAVEQQASGDLNGDGRADLALVLHMQSGANRIAPSWAPDNRYDTNPRMLIVALAQPNGELRRVVADTQLIPRLENPNQDDPFDGLTIARGTLTVKLKLFMSAGGWEMNETMFRFRWLAGALRMVGFDRDSTHRGSGETEKVSINYLTGRKEITTGNIESDRTRRRTVVIPRQPLRAIGTIGDGLMFDPDGR